MNLPEGSGILVRPTFGVPGMRILWMAFGRNTQAHPYRPHHHVLNYIVYTVTHDHNATAESYTAEPEREPPNARIRSRRSVLGFFL